MNKFIYMTTLRYADTLSYSLVKQALHTYSTRMAYKARLQSRYYTHDRQAALCFAQYLQHHGRIRTYCRVTAFRLHTCPTLYCPASIRSRRYICAYVGMHACAHFCVHSHLGSEPLKYKPNQRKITEPREVK